MTTLWLVRHGVASGQDGRLIGHLDLPISPEGEAAIRHLVRPGGERPARIISSDLARARSSAALLADGWGLPVVHDQRLREMSFGDWEGMTFAEALMASGSGFRDWAAAWSTARVPGGEGFMDVCHRVGAWWREEGAALEGTTCIVGHGGSLRALLVEVFQRPPHRAFEFACDHAHASVVQVTDGRAELVQANAPRLP